jgi:AcrR family transcriptional regulator
MQAAMAVVDTDGFEALTLSRVAAHLGVGPSALYTHVDGLAGLHHSAGVEATRLLTIEVRDAAIGRAGGDALRSAAAAYRAYAKRHPGRFTATLRVVATDDSIHAANAELDAVFVLLGNASGRSGATSERIARNVRRAIHGFVVVEHSSGADATADADYRGLIDALCEMLTVPQ